MTDQKSEDLAAANGYAKGSGDFYECQKIYKAVLFGITHGRAAERERAAKLVEALKLKIEAQSEMLFAYRTEGLLKLKDSVFKKLEQANKTISNYENQEKSKGE